MPETLKGFIERVTYHNPENGIAVLRVKVQGRDDLVSVIGNTTSVTAGEYVEASGRWVIDREHGQQFKADELKTTRPAERGHSHERFDHHHYELCGRHDCRRRCDEERRAAD